MLCYCALFPPAESSMGSSGLGAAGQNSASSLSTVASSSSAMGSVSKKVRKEPPPDSSCNSQDVENELPSEDDSKFLEDLEDKMKGEEPEGPLSPHVHGYSS